jgi:protein required for attachment to host cells
MHNETKATPKKPVVWILVADGRQAQIYTRKKMHKMIPMAGNAKHHHYDETGEQELVPVGEALHAESPEIYEKGRKSLGRVFESAGSAHHMGEPHVNIDDEIRAHFVKKIASHLNTARAQRQFNRLVLIAPAKLLGELREHLGKTVEMSVMAELSKDLTHCDNKSLAAHLEDIA